MAAKKKANKKVTLKKPAKKIMAKKLTAKELKKLAGGACGGGLGPVNPYFPAQ